MVDNKKNYKILLFFPKYTDKRFLVFSHFGFIYTSINQLSSFDSNPQITRCWKLKHTDFLASFLYQLAFSIRFYRKFRSLGKCVLAHLVHRYEKILIIGNKTEKHKNLFFCYEVDWIFDYIPSLTIKYFHILPEIMLNLIFKTETALVTIVIGNVLRANCAVLQCIALGNIPFTSHSDRIRSWFCVGTSGISFFSFVHIQQNANDIIYYIIILALANQTK